MCTKTDKTHWNCMPISESACHSHWLIRVQLPDYTFLYIKCPPTITTSRYRRSLEGPTLLGALCVQMFAGTLRTT
ncbi:hypothetical protein K474DRAFT_1503629 [Panus rudis PR-1116 ss-1]|nr:hypothetical protein K474DRAFT_1503629 [Panus rudis PR-1116 ss-1]